MQPTAQHISISDLPMIAVACLLFLVFWGGALVIHWRNQVNNFDDPAPKSLAWARCSRRLYFAAIWAAFALIAPMIGQFFALMNAWTNMGTQNFSDVAFLIGVSTLVVEAFALVVSIVFALNAATNLLPRFDPFSGALVERAPEKIEAEPQH